MIRREILASSFTRKTLVTVSLAMAVVLGAMLILLLVPGNGSDKETVENDQAKGPEGPSIESETVRENSHTEAGTQAGSGLQVIPRIENGSPGLLVRFPDPQDWEAEPLPESGYTDLCGHWVLETEGSPYALSNCHLMLNRDGTVTTPEGYDPVFEIARSEYHWAPGEASFRARLQMVLKMGSSSTTVPVEIQLLGSVSGSLRDIIGCYQAIPLGEAYSSHVQQGGFRLHR